MAMRRWGIGLGSSLVGIAVGILLSSSLLSRFSITAAGVVDATLVFWVVYLVASFVALHVLVREPSTAEGGLLALASTILSLIIVNAVVDGLTVHGIQTYVAAAVIIWLTTSVSDVIGRRMILARRRQHTAT
jgi:hypothetical protein